MGRVVTQVEAAARSVLGSKTQIERGGSQRHHTDLSTSDIDLVVHTANPMTHEEFARLATALQEQVAIAGSTVRIGQKTIGVQTAAGSVDVVPLRGEFIPGGATGAPVDRCAKDPKAQQAVRGVKDYAQKHGREWKGTDIERYVLQLQQREPRLQNFELAQRIIESLEALAPVEPLPPTDFKTQLNQRFPTTRGNTVLYEGREIYVRDILRYVATVTINGAPYTGSEQKERKMAEQAAARAALNPSQ